MSDKLNLDELDKTINKMHEEFGVGGIIPLAELRKAFAMFALAAIMDSSVRELVIQVLEEGNNCHATRTRN